MSLLKSSSESPAVTEKSKLMVTEIMLERLFKKPVNWISSTIVSHPKGRDYIEQL